MCQVGRPVERSEALGVALVDLSAAIDEVVQLVDGERWGEWPGLVMIMYGGIQGNRACEWCVYNLHHRYVWCVYINGH